MLNNDFGKYLSNINRDFIKFSEPKLAEYNLTMTMWRCLMIINNADNSCSQKYIAKQLNVDNAIITRNIKKLESLNYIEKKVQKNDNRFFELNLTEEGEKALSSVNKLQKQWYSKITCGFDENEISLLLNLLSRLCENI